MLTEAIAKTTDSPLSFIGSVAGASYGKDDPSRKRAVRCFKLGHMSVFEHVSAITAAIPVPERYDDGFRNQETCVACEVGLINNQRELRRR